MWRLADPYGACAGGYHELSVMCDRFHWARLLAFVTVWSAKKRVVLKRPPLPGDTHDVSRQAQTSRRGTRLASRACSHSPEPRPGWVPVSQDLMTNEAGPG